MGTLKELPFDVLLSSTVVREVRRHLTRLMEESQRSAKKALGDAIFAFGTTSPTRAELMDQLTGGQSPEIAAKQRLAGFLADIHCRVLDDVELVDTTIIFTAYFEIAVRRNMTVSELIRYAIQHVDEAGAERRERVS